ncbi:MAG TPA: hypothetical protein VFD43_12570, partial [Planctomycetota bacterium]|nr:hypothetical protein [Planctomycetota bacterium]
MIAAPTSLLTGFLAACLAVPAAPAPQQSRPDEITLKEAGSKPEEGTVVGEYFDALELEIRKGVKKKIEWSRIASVRYAELPPGYTEALDARDSDPEGAVQLLQDLIGTEGLGDVFRQQAMHELAAHQQRLGAFADAAGSWSALIAAFPEGRYLGAAARGQVDCLLAQGDAAGAGKA